MVKIFASFYTERSFPRSIYRRSHTTNHAIKGTRSIGRFELAEEHNGRGRRSRTRDTRGRNRKVGLIGVYRSAEFFKRAYSPGNMLANDVAKQSSFLSPRYDTITRAFRALPGHRWHAPIT